MSGDHHLSPEHLSAHAAIAGMSIATVAPQRYDRFGFLDAERHLLAHTEDEIWIGCDLQELDTYVCGDD